MNTKLVITLAVLLVAGLAASVLYDTNTSSGPCEGINGSVCTQSSCPQGYVATLQYTCSIEELTCCVPNARRE